MVVEKLLGVWFESFPGWISDDRIKSATLVDDLIELESPVNE